MKKLVLVLYLVIFAVAGYAQDGKEYTLGVDAFYDKVTGTWRGTDKKPVTGVFSIIIRETLHQILNYSRLSTYLIKHIGRAII
jgi:hypothetical protein